MRDMCRPNPPPPPNSNRTIVLQTGGMETAIYRGVYRYEFIFVLGDPSCPCQYEGLATSKSNSRNNGGGEGQRLETLGGGRKVHGAGADLVL